MNVYFPFLRNWHFIPKSTRSRFDDYERGLTRVWNSLPIEKAKYFSILDKGTTEDEFFISMRERSYLKISEAGYERVGHLVSATEAELIESAKLSSRELNKVKVVLSRMGLALGMDVSAWKAYRETVPPDFRLDVPAGIRLPKETGKAMLT